MNKIEIPAHGVCGRVEAQVMVKNAAGEIVPKQGCTVKCSNIVTNLGLNALKPRKLNALSMSALSDIVSIGTGTQAEETGVTGLVIAGRSGTGTRTTLPLFRIPDYNGTGKPLVVQEYIINIRFNPDGEARNYSEIGLGSPTALHTYTLFKNSETQVPETLTVLGDEYLDLSYYYQVQGQTLSGFTYNAHVRFANGLSALADRVSNQPLGPFPMSGIGVPPDTKAYVLLFPLNGSLTSPSAGGVYYFTSEDADKMSKWNPSKLRPASEFQPVDSGDSRTDMWSLYSDWAELSSNAASGAGYGLRFPEEYRPRNKSAAFTSSGSSWVIAPGVLTTSEDIYVVGYGCQGSGGIITFDKPITVTKDSRFEVTRSVYPMWDTKPAVNSTFVANPAG